MAAQISNNAKNRECKDLATFSSPRPLVFLILDGLFRFYPIMYRQREFNAWKGQKGHKVSRIGSHQNYDKKPPKSHCNPSTVGLRQHSSALLQYGTISIPHAIAQLSQTSHFVFVNPVVVTSMVNQPQNGADGTDGQENAKPGLKVNFDFF